MPTLTETPMETLDLVSMALATYKSANDEIENGSQSIQAKIE